MEILTDEAPTGVLPLPVEWFGQPPVECWAVPYPPLGEVMLPVDVWRRTDDGFELNYEPSPQLYAADASRAFAPVQRVGRGYVPRHRRGKK